MRISRTATTAALFLIMLSMIVPIISAADIQEAVPAGTMPVNDTSLSSAAIRGPGASLSSFAKQEEITLYRFELDQTTFLGPRSMAFGPRSIQLTTSPASLIILGIGIVAGGAVLFVMFRQRKSERE